MTRDHFVEVDLGDKAPTGGPLWLVAKGWLHPADSSINIAMSQGMHEAPRWLSLEVPDGAGGWKVARPNLGFPAGRKKICLIDLAGLFKPGTPKRLRLRTNLEVFWDSIQWAQGLPGDQAFCDAPRSCDCRPALPWFFNHQPGKFLFARAT